MPYYGYDDGPHIKNIQELKIYKELLKGCYSLIFLFHIYITIKVFPVELIIKYHIAVS